MEEDAAIPRYDMTKNIVFTNNTWVTQQKDAPTGFISFVNRADSVSDFYIDGPDINNMPSAAMVIKNNLFVDTDDFSKAIHAPLGLGQSDNGQGKGWHFDNSSIDLTITSSGHIITMIPLIRILTLI